jgi:O-antigen ligase
MPPQIALLVFTAFILVLLFLDIRSRPEVSRLLWLPVAWFTIVGSRPVSLWFDLGKSMDNPDQYLEGSPLDRSVFLVLIMLGVAALFTRRRQLEGFVRRNRWLVLLFLFAAVSMAWSDYPFVSFKRWVKGFGNLTMVLMVLTEDDPLLAIRTLFRRCFIVLIPMSVLLIKYYPEFGRSYLMWTWKPTYIGVTTNKNTLGALCLSSGLFYVWELARRFPRGKPGVRLRKWSTWLLLSMVLWLLYMADSATSLASLMAGSAIVVGVNLPVVKRNIRHMGAYVVSAVFIFVVLQLAIDIVEVVILSLGRDVTLTGRSDLWRELWQMNQAPILGEGYGSFWLGERAEYFWEMYYWHPNQAHNGYLETLINLGWVGLSLMIMTVVGVYRDIRSRIDQDLDLQRFRLGLLVAICLHNITEATFLKELSLLWFVFLLAAVAVRRVPVEAKAGT